MSPAHIKAASGIQSAPIEPLHRTSLVQYYRSVTRRFGLHHAVGLPAFEAPGQRQNPDRIEDLFVLPYSSPDRISPEEMERSLLSGGKATLPIKDMIATFMENRRVVLLADPGMGKSTLVQWLCVTLTNPIPPSEVASFGRAIPMPFILRDLMPLMPRELKDWSWKALVEAFLNHQHDEEQPAMARPLKEDQDTLRDVLDSPQAWFLIDGLDEVGDKTRRTALRNVLWQGFEAHQEARFLITSRVVGYEEAVVDRERTYFSKPEYEAFLSQSVVSETRKTPILGEYDIRTSHRIANTLNRGRNEEWLERDVQVRPGAFVEGEAPTAESIEVLASYSNVAELAALLHLAPWDNSQQSAFAENWFRQRLGDSDGPVRAREFIKAVRDHPSTSTIGRVPNLLLLMALLYRYRADLPHGRAKVYAGISQAYLENIAVVRRIDHRTSASVPYTLPQKERLLAIIAMHMQVRRTTEDDKEDDQAEGEMLASRKDLESWLCAEFGKDTDQDNAREMELFIAHIADSSGLLLKRGVVDGVEQFAFAHLSFQEYYTACWLELEFSRLLNQMAGGDDLLDAPAPPPPEPLAMSQLRFAEYAAASAWREPLLFLAEKLSERPSDTQTLRKWLFPIRKDETLPMPAQQLLATLSLDPQVNFSPQQRQAIWEHLCRAHVTNSEIWYPWNESVAPSLLSASAHQAAIFHLLVRLAAEINVRILNLGRCVEVSDLAPLKDLHQLQALFLTGCTSVSDLSALEGLKALQKLSLNRCTGVSDLSPLKGLQQLQELYLAECTGVSDLSPLEGLQALRELSLFRCTGVTDLSPLKDLQQLQMLYLTGCTGVCDLSSLEGLQALQELSLDRCTGVSDLMPLKDLHHLQTLSLQGCTGVSELSPLKDLKQLHTLDLDGCTGLKNAGDQIAALRKALPKCSIIEYQVFLV